MGRVGAENMELLWRMAGSNNPLGTYSNVYPICVCCFRDGLRFVHVDRAEMDQPWVFCWVVGKIAKRVGVFRRIRIGATWAYDDPKGFPPTRELFRQIATLKTGLRRRGLLACVPDPDRVRSFSGDAAGDQVV